jgi:hypothetical protein
MLTRATCCKSALSARTSIRSSSEGAAVVGEEERSCNAATDIVAMVNVTMMVPSTIRLRVAHMETPFNAATRRSLAGSDYGLFSYRPIDGLPGGVWSARPVAHPVIAAVAPGNSAPKNHTTIMIKGGR